MVAIVLLLLHSVRITYMASSESHSWKGISQASVKPDIFISENDGTLKNAHCDNPLRLSIIFNYNETQRSKWIQIIQYYTCDRRIQLKQFNKYYMYDLTKRKVLKYGTKMRYDVATTAAWNSNNTNSSDNINNTNNNYNNINSNSNMKDIINDSGHVIDFHDGDLVDSKHEEVIEKPNDLNQ